MLQTFNILLLGWEVRHEQFSKDCFVSDIFVRIIPTGYYGFDLVFNLLRHGVSSLGSLEVILVYIHPEKPRHLPLLDS